MKFAALIIGSLAYLFYPDVVLAAGSKLVTVNTPSGKSQPFLFAIPDNPKASVILFVGGNGVLGISDSGNITKNKNNFLVRTFDDFVDKGFMVALVDVPSGKKKLKPKFRIGKEHAGDMMAVIKHMKNKAEVPVWLIGTSMGTLSAAGVAIKKQNQVSGLILTSTVTRPSESKKDDHKFAKGALEMNLQKFKKPVLIVAHKRDNCVVSPSYDAPNLKRKFSGSSRIDVVTLEGGKDPKSGPCDGLSKHGFYGIEREAVDRIAAFITQ